MCSKATSSTFRDRGHLHAADARGITLVELVVVLAVLGIISAVAAMSLREPVQGYIDSNRRAQLTDIGDTALRRIARDLRLALPNSVRVTGADPLYMELLLTKTGGRYRAQLNGSSAGDILDFTATDSSFDTLGPMAALSGQAVAANDVLVVHNLFADPGVTTSNAYTYNQAPHCSAASSPNCNTTTIGSTGAGSLANETKINFVSRQFPLSSPGNRFQIISGPVTYVCDPGPVGANGNGTGTLTRVSNYTIQLAQPVGAIPGSTVALLAQNVTDCQITYNPLVLTQGLGLVSMRLALTRGNETVNLYHEVHVVNIP
jgi:MSHA biogenesis protein MshO